MIALYLAPCTKENEHDIGCRLAVYAAKDAFGIDCRLAHDSRGKPYFEASPVHVSISHSDGMCLAAVSDREIGADIERIRPRDTDRKKRLASRFFAPDEAAAVHADPAEFYRIWTAKESFIKYTGEGFSRPLPSFSIFGSALTFTHINYGDYAVAVCAEESAADAPLRIVSDF